MRPSNTLTLMLVCWAAFAVFSQAQQPGVGVRVGASVHSQSSEFKVERAVGIGSDLQMLFHVGRGLHFKVGAGYDYLWLRQWDVLDEWKWDYWEKTYLDFLPGAKAQRVNQRLRYTSADSIYSAVFHPSQQLKELRLVAGAEQVLRVSDAWRLEAGCTFGVDLFYRELEMREEWTKRFNVDTTSADLDYGFRYRLLHFAPTRKGASLFVAPSLGVRLVVSPAIDIGGQMAYVHYFRGDRYLGVRLSKDGATWFPLKGKVMCGLGVIFKY